MTQSENTNTSSKVGAIMNSFDWLGWIKQSWAVVVVGIPLIFYTGGYLKEIEIGIDNLVTKFEEMKQDNRDIHNDMSTLKNDINEIKLEQRLMKREVNSIKKDVQ